MKSYTDLEQSKKLAEILPIEGADMRYAHYGDTHPWFCNGPLIEVDATPAWSLASLLNYLREIDMFPEIKANEFGVTMNISFYDVVDGCRLALIDSINVKAESFIDACYEIIIKLHGKNCL